MARAVCAIGSGSSGWIASASLPIAQVIKKVDFVKIITSGFEPEILRGMTWLYRNTTTMPLIFFECNGKRPWSSMYDDAGVQNMTMYLHDKGCASLP